MKFNPSSGANYGSRKNFRALSLRLSAVVMFFVTSVFAATTIKAQNAKITLPSKQVAISAIFSAIEKQTEYLVVYGDAEINVNKKVTLPAASTQMGTALGVVAKATGTKYEISNKYVVFSKASASAAAASGKGAVKVSGKVVDASTGEPIAGLHFA